MRIALFTETYLPYINGVVTHVKALKDGLEALGHDVLVVTADAAAKRHYIRDGVLHCPAVNSKKFYNYSIAGPVSRGRLLMLTQFNPDIIHIHNEFGIGMSGAIIAQILKVPLVYTLHTMYDDYIYYVAPKPFVPLVKKTSHKYAKLLASRASALTGPSKKVEEFFRDCGVKKPVSVIPNPVELDKFSPQNVTAQQRKECRDKIGAGDDTLVACFCGRLGREKSVDIMLRYWAETVRPSDHFKLMIIGDGPCRKELTNLAKSLGISDMVYFTGAVLHDDLLPYYAASDLYITTSVSDTNSISMLEGMAMGLPVLHIRDELNRGQVRDGVNGYVFGTAQEMYEHMKRYQESSAEFKEAFSQSVRQSVQNSGAETLGRNLIAVYQQAIKTYTQKRENAKRKKNLRYKQHNLQ